ncbi:CDF family Co(II)/Ni(II) efflux transporter DmeF [Desulfofustis glycolicus]|uniref:Cation diffusion facilitator family transporter n=1 Tax=Desulfofustis glycolicus DSM 9705 TaxID=1121409 RepID=A0A1M5XRF5_9BACT|nr:CDF family Co(II)/Ni(II) efflux transporter DmeF [Desulfofustis glycolicus]MCB2217845.1 CDF family Co(II)/Ni(II) efflux transporter DmeF [Desulfobulbaceae bacterium]SHI02339.1 cation diffusion facilitator family transporter [Desulfofustis glycolicus DSM 9705]
MHHEHLADWQHDHRFSPVNEQGEKRTLYVLILTAVTMIVEITAGSIYGSMALLADGWHMATHVAAFFITIFAYRYARKHADDPAYTFGTGKVNVLGGFASAIALAVVALVMLIESLERIVHPQDIRFNEAIAVAVLGLLVNVISALLLRDGHSHDHGHDHGHDDDPHHGTHLHDHNLTAAYFHVLADALTSLLAIVALVSGKFLGWHWLDPVMGIVGAAIITRWSYGLLKQTGPILLDASIDKGGRQAIVDAIENDADNRISDIHVWKVGASHYAAIIAIVTSTPRSAEHYKALLRNFDRLSHVTVEINTCSSSKHAPTIGHQHTGC